MKSLLSVTATRAIRTHSSVIAGSVVVLLTGVLTGVLSARWLGPEVRGEFTATWAWAGFLGVLVSVGVPQSVVVDRGDLDRLVRPLGVHLCAALGFSLICGLVLAGTYQPWLSWSGIIGIGLIATGGAAAGVAAGLAQRAGSMRIYFQVARVVPPLSTILVMVALILVDSRSSNTWLLMTGAALCITGIALVAGGLPKRSSGKWLHDRGFLNASVGAFGVTLASQVVYRLDSLIVALVAPPREVAFYAVGVAALAACFAVAQSAGFVAFSTLRSLPRELVLHNTLRSCGFSMALSLLIALSLWLAMPTLIEFLYGASFARAVPVARVLVLVAIPMSVDFALTHVLLALDRGKIVRRLRTIEMLIGLPVAWFVASTGNLVVLAVLVIVLFASSAVALSWLIYRELSNREETHV